MKSRTRRQFRAEEKAELVAACQSSGLSLRDFAERQGIAASNLQRWVHQQHRSVRLRKPVPLVEVPNLLAVRPGPGAYRLHFPHGVELELPRGFEVEEVRALAQLLCSL
jgi:hypothetical protein